MVWQNQRQGYALLFRAVQETLREVAANARHLEAQVGLLLVLHTWGQDLHYHPHLHVVATGGLACDADGVVRRMRQGSGAFTASSRGCQRRSGSQPGVGSNTGRIEWCMRRRRLADRSRC